MQNDLNEAANVFSEQTKRLQIALYYTYGDEDKAKKMINDSYRDLVVIKGKFSSASVYGAFLLFINTGRYRIYGKNCF